AGCPLALRCTPVVYARFTTCRVGVICRHQQKRRGKYSFKQHSLNLDIEVKCAFDFPRLISSADDGIYSH
ncbi:MAG: hypothetical protein ACEQR7_07605, partial [Agathobacter rectalis]